MSKVMGTDTVIALNRTAVRKHYNRTLSSRFIERLDDDGVNIIVTHLLHGDGAIDVIDLLLNHLDLDMVARDCSANGEVDFATVNGTVYAFDPNA